MTMTSGRREALESPSGIRTVHPSKPPASMLNFDHVTKRYGTLTALDGVSLHIKRGEFFGLLGPNGAGKSTFMALVGGLRTPDSGQITLDGSPLVAGRPEARAQLGLVPQHIALYPRLTAEQNLRIFGQLYGLGGAILRERITEGLEAMQLADRRHEAVQTFSGGMQRRLNIVASLLHRPRLLLCDEPTVGVDPQSRNAIFEFLQKLNREGLTVIYSTHYMEEATRLCSRIGIIDQGRILALGTLDELLLRLPFEEEIRFPLAPDTRPLAQQLAAHGAIAEGGEVFHFRPRPGYQLSGFYGLTESLGLSARLFTSERPTLEALFLHLTGRQLRE
jgi:ABC-2 type transport system ATP-binding protein